jgi:hypothetical protein
MEVGGVGIQRERGKRDVEERAKTNGKEKGTAERKAETDEGDVTCQ